MEADEGLVVGTIVTQQVVEVLERVRDELRQEVAGGSDAAGHGGLLPDETRKLLSIKGAALGHGRHA